MDKFRIRLTFTSRAENFQDAVAIGHGAMEHLFETFNDDGSIQPRFTVTADEEPADG